MGPSPSTRRPHRTRRRPTRHRPTDNVAVSLAAPRRSRRQRMSLDVQLHRLLRRYEPLVIAFAIAFTIVELVSPLHVARVRGPGLTPFAAPTLEAPAGDNVGSTGDVASDVSTGGGLASPAST